MLRPFVEARRTYEPDPVVAAALAEQGGADGITFHLREDERHIQDRDVAILKETVTVKTNLEIACGDEVVDIACKTLPTTRRYLSRRAGRGNHRGQSECRIR